MSNNDNDHTRIVRRSSSGSPERPFAPPPPQQGDPEATVYVHGQPGSYAPGPDGTRIVQRGGDEAPPPPPAEGQTVLVRPSSRSAKAGSSPGQTGAEPAPDDFLPEGPVVGWLVVVKGPGRGRSVTLGYGMNPVGRDTDNRAPLPFGDALISRKKHAVVTYDPRGRKFYLQQGESSNLTYIGEMPVLAPTLLNGGETILIGETELRFVPLCGEDFDWEQAE